MAITAQAASGAKAPTSTRQRNVFDQFDAPAQSVPPADSTQFEVTAPDGTVYEVTGPPGATPEQALAQVQAQHPAKPNVFDQFDPKPAAPKPVSQLLGAEEGATNVFDRGAQALKYAANRVPVPFTGGKGLGDAVDSLGQAIGLNSVEGANARHRAYFADQEQTRTPGKIGRFAGEVAATIPVALVTKNPWAAGAISTPLMGDSETPEGVAGEAGLGALTGGTGDKLLKGAAYLAAPVVRPAVAALRDAGVTMTPGQIFGGLTKGVEDRVAGFPIVGDWIKDAQRRSVEDFNRAAINRSLAPLGRSLPADTAAGHDAVAFAGDALGETYDRLLPQISTKLDSPFSQAIADAGATVDARLPNAMGEQFQSTLADVFKKLGTPQGMGPANTFGGRATKDVAIDLGALKRSYSGSADANQRALGGAYADVARALDDAVARSNPQLSAELGAIDQGYANLVPIERAAANATGNASGKAAGVFTPQQLRQAVRQGDTSVRDRATARGSALMQDLAENGIQVLPSSVPDSGTAGRLLLGTPLVTHNPVALGAAAAVPAVYSKPGLRVVNKVLARKASAGEQSLADLLSTLAQYSAPLSAAGITEVKRAPAYAP